MAHDGALPIEGAANRYGHRAGNDDYTQAGNLAVAGAMQGVPEAIQRRQIAHFAKAIRPMAQVLPAASASRSPRSR